MTRDPIQELEEACLRAELAAFERRCRLICAAWEDFNERVDAVMAQLPPEKFDA